MCCCWAGEHCLGFVGPAMKPKGKVSPQNDIKNLYFQISKVFRNIPKKIVITSPNKKKQLIHRFIFHEGPQGSWCHVDTNYICHKTLMMFNLLWKHTGTEAIKISDMPCCNDSRISMLRNNYELHQGKTFGAKRFILW